MCLGSTLTNLASKYTSAATDPIILFVNVMICEAPASLNPNPSFFASYTPVLVNVLERLGVIDGEDTEETLPCPHVLIPHGAVLFLTCSVQDVQQAGLPVNHDLFPVRVLQKKGGKLQHLDSQ